MKVLPIEEVTIASRAVRLRAAADVKSSLTTLAIPSVAVSSLDVRVTDLFRASFHTTLAGKI